MSTFENPLAHLEIASPCTADWNRMTGDERVRFCGECQLNVYNLSGMTRQEAESLLQRNEEKMCIRYFQRADGTVITQDCPVGLKVLHQRKRVRMKLAGVAAAVTLMTAVGLFALVAEADTPGQKDRPSINQVPHNAQSEKPDTDPKTTAIPNPSSDAQPGCEIPEAWSGKPSKPKSPQPVQDLMGRRVIRH